MKCHSGSVSCLVEEGNEGVFEIQIDANKFVIVFCLRDLMSRFPRKMKVENLAFTE